MAHKIYKPGFKITGTSNTIEGKYCKGECPQSRTLEITTNFGKRSATNPLIGKFKPLTPGVRRTKWADREEKKAAKRRAIERQKQLELRKKYRKNEF